MSITSIAAPTLTLTATTAQTDPVTRNKELHATGAGREGASQPQPTDTNGKPGHLDIKA